MNKTRQAILFAILAAFGFSIQDTAVKALTSNASIWQLMFIRSLIVVSILGLWAFSSGVMHQIKPKTWFWPIIRAICMSLAYTFFYASLPFVALSEASSCFFTAPIFVCVFAKKKKKEKRRNRCQMSAPSCVCLQRNEEEMIFSTLLFTLVLLSLSLFLSSFLEHKERKRNTHTLTHLHTHTERQT